MNSVIPLLTVTLVLTISVFGLPSYNDYDGFSRNIPNGFPTTHGQFPFTVLVAAVKPTELIGCSGALLNKQWVLTAASCASNASEFILELGVHNLTDPNEIGGIAVVAKTAIIHSEYNPETHANDLALIKLSTAVEFTDKIQPALLPSAADILVVDRSVIAVGWGLKNSENDNLASILQWAPLNIVANELCDQNLDPHRKTIVCAESERKQSVCNTDAGSPLVLESDNRTLVGIISFGNVVGCQFGVPQAFSRIASYVDWITSNLKNN